MTTVTEISSPTAERGDAPRRPTTQVTICQVLHSLAVGGAEVLAARLARQLTDRYRFIFACLDDLGTLGSELRAAGFQIELLSRRPGFDLACAKRLRQLVKSEHVDLLHAHQYTPFSYAVMSGLVRRRPPVLFTEHGRWFPDLRRPKRVAFNRLFLRRRDQVVAVGQSVRRALIENEGIPGRRIEVIYNGVDFSPFDRPADKSAVRRELGLRDNDFVLMQVARLDALKDHLTAVRTLERLVRVRPETRLVLVGEGPEQAAIENELRSRGVASYALLVGLRNDVPRLLAAADAFLLTSVSEGIPLTLIEAMGAELPVVSTAVGGIPEVVIDGETGLLAPSGDDAALAEAVLRLASDAALSRRLGGAGAERARELFSEQKNHEAYVRLYDQMLAG